jgi:hypothetical protein
MRENRDGSGRPQTGDRTPGGEHRPKAPRSPGRKSSKKHPHDINLDDLLPFRALAVKLKVKLRTVRQWKYDGKIPYTSHQDRDYVIGEEIKDILRRNLKLGRRRPGRSRLHEVGQGWPEIDLDDLFTLKEVAVKFGVKVRTVRNWKGQGLLSYTRIDRLLYVLGEELREMLRRNHRPALRRPPSKAPREQGGDSEEKRGSDQ